MDIELYLSQLSHADRFSYNKFNIFYYSVNKRDQCSYLYWATRDAQNEQYTYREVLKLISI